MIYMRRRETHSLGKNIIESWPECRELYRGVQERLYRTVQWWRAVEAGGGGSDLTTASW